MFWLFVLIALVLVAVVLGASLAPYISAALAKVKTVAPPAPQGPTFTDSSGVMFDITPAKPCDSPIHACRFTPAPAEECLLTKAEKAVATLGEFAPRAKAISKKVRGELQQSFDFAEAATP